MMRVREPRWSAASALFALVCCASRVQPTLALVHGAGRLPQRSSSHAFVQPVLACALEQQGVREGRRPWRVLRTSTPRAAAEDGGDELTMQETGAPSLEKRSFGGGSGGAATLDDPDFSVNTILKQLESIQQGTPKNIVILGTRHCSFLHQQIIELLSYALVLSDNHIYTSGATGTHAATIRGALRANNPDLLTVILPQTLARQPREIRELLGQVEWTPVSVARGVGENSFQGSVGDVGGGCVRDRGGCVCFSGGGGCIEPRGKRRDTIDRVASMRRRCQCRMCR